MSKPRYFLRCAVCRDTAFGCCAVCGKALCYWDVRKSDGQYYCAAHAPIASATHTCLPGEEQTAPRKEGER